MLSLFLAMFMAAAPVGQTRTYYIAADELDWDFAPSHTDKIHGQKYDLKDDPGSKGEIDPNATSYRKVRFREYTDNSFKTLKPVPSEWEHLGILGPVIRAEVGDTIKVVFKNNATRPYSIHVHGVLYNKDSEGAPYNDGTAKRDTGDDAVPPGATYTYTYQVPPRAGPGPHDGNSVMWMYHSHTNEIADTNGGLVGPM